MLSEERLRAILQILHKDGRVLVGGLAKRLHTSLITIRKDLEHLHQHGQLQRTHGGALPISAGVTKDSSLREKEQWRQDEKRRIARAAAPMIQLGQVIILDSGTTTTAIAQACREIRNLSIITNATNIAAELSDAAFDVILTGGTLRKNSLSLIGPFAEESLRKLSADLLFLAVHGFDVSYGLTAPNLLEARVNRVVAEAARLTIVVCDSSKFGRRNMSLILPTSAVHETITDKGIAKTDLRLLRKANVEVTTV
jgi:DeoR family transcriptional regulator, aga operon transcriptional repressor